MTFWTLVVGVPTTLAALATGFALSRTAGVIMVGALAALLTAVAVLGYRPSPPSHLEKLVARDYEYLGYGGKLPHVECWRAVEQRAGRRVYGCAIGVGSGAEQTCVVLTERNHLKYVTECTRGKG